MTEARAHDRELVRSKSWPYVLALLTLKLGVGAALVLRGFHGISDDDFARVVIAQRFAEAPALDPSGTSWLPVPFWIYGSLLALFGSTPAVARVTALLLGAGAMGLLFAAGRALGQSPRIAALGAAIAALFPYSAYLGAATVPEVPAAALSVFGAATLARAGNLRYLGALALACATASRYEPWAAALAFSAISTAEAIRSRDAKRLGPAILALAFPLLWLLHGVFRHGDALFFVTRVSAYRAALGLAPTALPSALLAAPRALVTQEPELFLAFAAALSLRLRSGRASLAKFTLFAAPLAAVLLMLVLGDARGSAPTHHGERALLPIWYGLALVLADCLTSSRSRLAALLAGSAASLWIRPAFPRDPFAERASELALGASARKLGVEQLAIHTRDYGFFAVQAAFGSPRHTHVFRDNDPRSAPAPSAHELDGRALSAFAAGHATRWLVLPLTQAELYRDQAELRATHPPLALVELNAPQASPGRP